jgi:SAM-dependent methyltransferase
MSDLKSTYNKIAQDWHKDHDGDIWWQEGTDIFLSFLQKNSSILDVGCAGGYKTRYIANKGYTVTGIDFSEEMIKIAKKDAPDLTFDVVDIFELDTYQKKFDGIFAQAVLLHVPKSKIMSVLESLKNKLHENGLLYIAVKGVKDDGVEEKVITEKDYGYSYERFFSFFSEKELREYFKQLNMTIVWEGNTYSGRANWVQIIAKY